MNVFEIARTVFFGNSLSEKLTARAVSFSDIDFTWAGIRADLPAGVKPGRPATWISGKSAFPKKSELSSPLKRAEALHFFANHELLAIETMAYVFLKFPDADPEFLRGLYGVMRDEQKHFYLYIERMRELGLEFGQLNLNEYFWSVMQTMQTPYDFVVRMNLTFEQANLDFALEYAAEFDRLGDHASAKILKIVHDDEVRHVGHGVEWFKKWKPVEAKDMDAFRDALPHPMTTRRARGNTFDQQGRLDAGMSAEWVREMKVAGGSRGRRTKHWLPNFFAEYEAEQGRTVRFEELPKSFQEKVLDLEPLWLWLGEEADCVYRYGDAPSIEFREYVSQFKKLPEVKSVRQFPSRENIPPGNELQFWYSGIGIRNLFQKSFWAKAIPRSFATNDTAMGLWIAKPDFGTSGRGQKVGQYSELSNPNFKGVVEPFREIQQEFSVQCEIDSTGAVTVLGALEFLVGKSRQFLGVRYASFFLWEILDESRRAEWQKWIDQASEVLRAEKFVGAFGIDAYTFRDNEHVVFEPFSELNPRWTFGRVALELEMLYRKKVNPGSEPAAWLWFTKGDLVRHGVSNFSELRLKLLGTGLTVVPTTDELNSRGVWTAWVSGPGLDSWIKQA